MKLNALIIDDEQPARKLLEGYINKIDFLFIAGSFKSALQAIPLLKKKRIDILFLDIRMPDISGLDFIGTLESKPNIILTTAYREYALEGYELDIADYLLKPIEFSRFLKAINKVTKREKIISQEALPHLRRANHILIKHKNKQFKVALEDVLFVKAENEYVDYYLRNGKKILIYGSLKQVENKLTHSEFIRVHRSYLINLDKITYIEGNRVVILDYRIPISETYKKKLIERWKQ